MSLPRLGYDPREGRDAKSSPPIEWIPALGCWCVFETGAITAILKSSDFVAADFAKWHHSLGKMGIDCSSVIEILDYVAIANEGKRHAEIRNNMARVIAAQARATKEAAGEKMTELVPLLCREDASVDLVREIIRPVCDTLFETLLGAAAPSDDGISASQIFDLYLSLNRRKEIVSMAGAMLETYSGAQDSLNTAPGYATSLRMLGYDSIVGSLGGSILHELKRAPGERLCDIAYPKILPKTGVPYIERLAAEDCTFGKAAIRKGDRIRLYLDPGTQHDHANNGECNFGRGRHSCLGEDLSNWLWRALSTEFGRLPLRCTVESEVRRKPDWVFAYYSSVVVRFHA
jgi:cytochrome P450